MRQCHHWAFFLHYLTGRRQITKVRVKRWLSLVFSRKNICKETIPVCLSVYAPPSYMNTGNRIGIVSIICSATRMCELKYFASFITILFVYAYVPVKNKITNSIKTRILEVRIKFNKVFSKTLCYLDNGFLVLGILHRCMLENNQHVFQPSFKSLYIYIESTIKKLEYHHLNNTFQSNIIYFQIYLRTN